MSETILRIGLSELKTIRIKINGIVSEMALDITKVSTFTQEQQLNNKLSKEAARMLSDMVTDIVRTAALEDVKIEFVLPANREA